LIRLRFHFPSLPDDGKMPSMTKTQVQIPDGLYNAAKRIARDREWSFAEVVCRGLEYVVRIYPPLETSEPEAWQPPKPVRLGCFRSPPENWRELTNE
jgi:hypothetical protein